MKKIGLIVLAWISTSMLALVLREMTVPVYSMVYLFIFMLECAGLMKVNVYHHFEKNDWPGIFLSFLFGFMTLLGFFLGRQMNIGPRRMLISTVAAVGLTPVIYHIIFCNAIWLFQKVSIRTDTKRNISDQKFFFIGIAFFVLAWIPAWLAFYPGLWGYDVPGQLPQHLGTYTTQHPLLHTLLLQYFYQLGVILNCPDVGVSLYTFFQMAVFASSLSYMMLLFYRKGMQKRYLIFLSCDMAFLPLFSNLAISATKDILFCSMFIYVCTLMAYFADHINDKKKQAGFVISITLCGLLRNNAKYAIIVLIIYAIWHYRQDIKKQKMIIIVGAFVLTIICAINFTLAAYTQAEPGSPNEMLSVPYQQIARVYIMDSDKLSQQQRNQIRELMPYVDRYSPPLADNVKADATGPENITKMSKLYLELMLKFPLRYLEAALLNTMGYWYIDDISCSRLYGGGANPKVGYFWLYIWDHMGIEHVSKLPALENVYLNGFGRNEYQNIPIFACFFNYALYIWSILICVSYVICKRINKYNIMIVFVLILLGTYLLGPGACSRYALPFIACTPLFVFTVFSNQADQQEQKISE